MSPFLVSTGVVALSEIGDKTQLLALVLAARFRAPVPIILGILIATVANHTLAGALGTWLTALLGPQVLRWTVGASFIGMGLWALVPDEDDIDAPRLARYGVFVTTVIAFFLAEMADKTQFATMALAARFNALVPVVAGTTLGMMLADVPAVLLGDRFAPRLPLSLVRAASAVLFIALGALTLLRPYAAFWS